MRRVPWRVYEIVERTVALLRAAERRVPGVIFVAYRRPLLRRE